ncbi:MAG: hypothetical protein ACLFNZ_08355 [Spirochaetaceae bacterium]
MNRIHAKVATFSLFAVIFCLLFTPSSMLCAEESTGTREEYSYEPYTKEEFPQWVRDLRRFETLLIGSLPFAFFFTNTGFETYAYVSRGFDEGYLPLFFGSSPEKEEYRQDTRMQRLAVSISISGAIALLDYFLGVFGTEKSE